MKVLILTGNYGEGHNSAASAIYEEFEKRNIDVEIFDTSALGNYHINKISKKIFNKTVTKTP